MKDRSVPVLCILAPIISVILDQNSEAWFYGYQFGFDILLVNAALTFIGLWFLYDQKPGYL